MNAQPPEMPISMEIVTDHLSIDRNAWLEFVSSHADGNIFQTPFMYDVYQRTSHYEPVVVAALDRGRVVGVLVAVIQREAPSLLGPFTARSIIWGGPLIAPEHGDFYGEILSAYEREVGGRAIYTQVRNLCDTAVARDQFEASGYEYEEHLDILVDLKPEPDVLWGNLKSSGRGKVRQARKEGVRMQLLTSDSEIKQSYEIIRDLYARIELPLPDESFFQAVYEVLFREDLIRYFGAYDGDRLIGVHYVTSFNDLLYSWYAGGSNTDLDKRPNDLLLWEIIAWGHENNYAVFDLGGAGKPGVAYSVRDHKIKYGGELVNFGRYMKVHKPLLFRLGELGLRHWKTVQKIIG